MSPCYVMICKHSSCLRQGSEQVWRAFQMADLPAHVQVLPSGCQGQCSISPIVRILPEESWYCRVTGADVPLIVEQHLKRGQPLKSKLHPRFHPQP